MIKHSLLITFVLFLIITFGAFATESDNGQQIADQDSVLEESKEELSIKTNYNKDEFQFTVNSGIGFNEHQWHFTGGLQADFYANPLLGIGFKSTIDYGLKYDNLNINLYALYKVWWLYIGPGISFAVQGMTIPENDPDYFTVYSYESLVSLALTGGMRFPIARIGPGFMTMDLSMDWYHNDIPLSDPTPPYNRNTLQELVYGSAYAFKFGVRLGYTF